MGVETRVTIITLLLTGSVEKIRSVVGEPVDSITLVTMSSVWVGTISVVSVGSGSIFEVTGSGIVVGGSGVSEVSTGFRLLDILGGRLGSTESDGTTGGSVGSGGSIVDSGGCSDGVGSAESLKPFEVGNGTIGDLTRDPRGLRDRVRTIFPAVLEGICCFVTIISGVELLSDVGDSCISLKGVGKFGYLELFKAGWVSFLSTGWLRIGAIVWRKISLPKTTRRVCGSEME